MTLTADQASLVTALRSDGASALETAAILEIVLELAHSDHWKMQPRGRHGEWTRVPGMRSVDSIAQAHNKAAAVSARRQSDMEQFHMRAVAEATAAARVHTRAAVTASHEKHNKDVHTLLSSIRSANKHLTDMSGKEETKKARIKLAIHIGALFAGGLMAYMEAHFGLPLHSENLKELIEAGSAVAPSVVQELIDAKKRL